MAEVEVQEIETTKEEIETMIERALIEIEVITDIVSTKDFDLSNKNYDLKFHYRVLTECISLLREMLIQDKWY